MFHFQHQVKPVLKNIQIISMKTTLLVKQTVIEKNRTK
jgi:hypothetical protein